MAGRMPVLGQDDVFEALCEAVDHRDDLVSFRNRQRAAGTEIVLHVDDDQRFVRHVVSLAGPYPGHEFAVWDSDPENSALTSGASLISFAYE